MSRSGGVPQGYDVIGDVHRHAQKLVELLEAIDHALVDDVRSHPSRQALFVGGPERPPSPGLARRASTTASPRSAPSRPTRWQGKRKLTDDQPKSTGTGAPPRC